MTIHDQVRAILETEYGLSPRSTAARNRPAYLSTGAKIGTGVRFGSEVAVHDGVEIGNGVQIGDRVTLRNCRLGDGVRVEDNCTIGYQTLTGGFSHKLEEHDRPQQTVICRDTLIRTGCVIYQSVTIGDHCWINHGVLLREHTCIGHHTCIGSMSDSEGYNTIGNHVLIHSQVHLCARLVMEDYVFVAPFTIFANGKPMNYARETESREQGATVRFGVQIGVNAVIMPRVELGYEAIIGPSAVVNRDVPSLTMMMGHPARIVGPVPTEMRMPLELRQKYYAGDADPVALDVGLTLQRKL